MDNTVQIAGMLATFFLLLLLTAIGLSLGVSTDKTSQKTHT
jgi:hypothetical protein